MSPDERHLINELREGHEQAYKHVFHLYYRPLTLFAMKYLDDVEESKEVVQDFFVRLWSRRESLEIRLSLKTYLYQGVRNACINFIASNHVKQRHLRDYKISAHQTMDALEAMVLAEQEVKLTDAINALPNKCRQIFLLSRMEQLSNRAIAEQLDLSIKTVEAQISIALKRLRDYCLLIILFGIDCMD